MVLNESIQTIGQQRLSTLCRRIVSAGLLSAFFLSQVVLPASWNVMGSSANAQSIMDSMAVPQISESKSSQASTAASVAPTPPDSAPVLADPAPVAASAVGTTNAQGKKTFKGSVVQVDQSPTVNEGELKTVTKGTKIEMLTTTPISIGVSASGDEFFGKITKDYTIDGKVVIPSGSLMHGTINNVTPPKRGGRDGHMAMSFDYLITPDGREIPLEGGYTNEKSKVAKIAKVVARGAGYTLAGGAIGAIMTLKYGGLAAVAATEGYALAGGAAVGSAVGLTAAMVTKGKSVTIDPGAGLSVKLQDDLVLPTVNMPEKSPTTFAQNGLDVKVTGFKVGKDPFGELSELTLSLDINNKTPNTFSFFDIALVDENDSVFYASPFGDTGMWFKKLGPNSHANSNLSFNVDNPKLKHHLVFYKQYSREPVAKIAIRSERTALDSKRKKRRHRHKASR